MQDNILQKKQYRVLSPDMQLLLDVNAMARIKTAITITINISCSNRKQKGFAKTLIFSSARISHQQQNSVDEM